MQKTFVTYFLLIVGLFAARLATTDVSVTVGSYFVSVQDDWSAPLQHDGGLVKKKLQKRCLRQLVQLPTPHTFKIATLPVATRSSATPAPSSIADVSRLLFSQSGYSQLFQKG